MFLFKKRTKFDAEITACESDHRQLEELKTRRDALLPQWKAVQARVEQVWAQLLCTGEMVHRVSNDTPRRRSAELIRGRDSALRAELVELEQQRDNILHEVDDQIEAIERAIQLRNENMLSAFAGWTRAILKNTDDTGITSYLRGQQNVISNLAGGRLKEIVELAIQTATRLENWQDDVPLPLYKLDAFLDRPPGEPLPAEPGLKRMDHRTADGQMIIAGISDVAGSKPILP